jgi:FAD/FMN-containing dehydrogenase
LNSFADFKKELVEAVGAENVIDDPKTLEEYSKDYSLLTARTPLLVVKPSSAEEVSKVVKISNKYLIPIVPRSSGVGFYGAAVPSESGIVVDLSRMNRILDIDERNRIVRFEPGVTWGKLQEELEKYDLMALNPLLPHPLKSALTSHLERERSLIPRQEYKEPLYSVEVVSPTGEILRTGLADIPQTKNKVHMPHPPRPMTINWRRVIQGAQGTLGIVTWGAAKVEYLPKLQKLYFIPFQDPESAVEATYRILRRVIGNECFMLNDFNLALITASLTGKSLEYFEELRKIMPPFTIILCSTGGRRLPEEKIAYEEEVLMEIALELGFEPSPTIAGVAGLGKLLMSVLRKPWPQDKTYWKFNFKGLSKDIFFLTTLDRTPRYTNLIYDIADKHKYPVKDVGIYVQPLEQGRACYCEYGLHLNPDVPEEVESVSSLWKEACEALMSNGAFFSRPYGELAPMVYGRCAAYYTALRRLKEVFDPNRIMNPGKLCL